MSYAFDLLFAIYPDASYPYMLHPQNVEVECERFLKATVPTFSALRRQVFIGHLGQHTDQIFRLDDLWVGRIGITKFDPEAMRMTAYGTKQVAMWAVRVIGAMRCGPRPSKW